MRELVIRPVLETLGLGGVAAEELLLGTALQETGCGRRLRQAGGPALGIFQMEPATHDDLRRWLESYPAILARLGRYEYTAISRVGQLASNLCYAAAMARIFYWRATESLPAAGDLAAQAAFYKARWNTPSGAATTAEYIANWRATFPHPHEGPTA